MYNRPLCEPLKECTVTYSAQSRDWVVYKHIIRSSIHQHFRMLKLGFVTNFPFSKTLLKFSSLHPISYWKRINLTSTSDDTHNYLVPTSRVFLLRSHRALYSCSSYVFKRVSHTALQSSKMRQSDLQTLLFTISYASSNLPAGPNMSMMQVQCSILGWILYFVLIM